MAQWGLSRLGLRTAMVESVTDAVEGSQELVYGSEVSSSGNSLGVYIIAALGIFALIVLLWLFFRWISGHGPKDAKVTGMTMVSTLSEQPYVAMASADRQRGPAAGVRRQYRRFLRLYKDKGIVLHDCDTSLDVQSKADKKFNDPEALEALRDLYIQARYDGNANGKAAALARRLYARLRKSD